MGIWAAIKGGLGLLEASPKLAADAGEMGKTITQGIVEGLDAVWHTKEEEVRDIKELVGAQQRGAEIVLQFWGAIANENTDRSRARRQLAVMTFQNFWRLVWFDVASVAVSLVFPKIAPVATTVFAILTSTIVTGLVLSVAATYFVPHQLSKLGTASDIAEVVKGKK